MGKTEILRSTLNKSTISHEANFDRLREDITILHVSNNSMADTFQEILKVVKEMQNQQVVDSTSIKEVHTQQKGDMVMFCNILDATKKEEEYLLILVVLAV